MAATGVRQHGFFIDLSRCIGCNACTIACKQWHNLQPGPVKWLRVLQWEKGAYPNVRIHLLPIMCLHCIRPVCIKACPNEAIFKDKEWGAVLVDQNKCQGQRNCFKACPYGAPQFNSDQSGATMSKCNMCIDRLRQGLKPICVLSCSMRALEFGPLEELQIRYGKLGSAQDLPNPKITIPAVVFRETDPKSKVIHWDSDRALELWRHRTTDLGDTLPPLFERPENLFDSHEEIVGRNRLVLKPRTVEEVMYYSCDDE